MEFIFIAVLIAFGGLVAIWAVGTIAQAATGTQTYMTYATERTKALAAQGMSDDEVTATVRAEIAELERKRKEKEAEG